MNISRSELGSWLSGPESHHDDWPGKDLGYPNQGSGSVAPLMRRVGQVFIDWFACLAISNLFFEANPWATLIIFWVENVVLISLLGTTLGHRIMGIRVARQAQNAPGSPALGADWPFPAAIALRSTLLCLVIPALLMNKDLRGVNDRLAGTIVVRS